MLRRATALKRICDRQRVQNAVASKLLFGAYILAVGNFISIILASKHDRHKIGWGVFGIIASIIYIIAISSINDAVSNSLRARDIIDSFFLNIWNLK